MAVTFYVILCYSEQVIEVINVVIQEDDGQGDNSGYGVQPGREGGERGGWGGGRGAGTGGGGVNMYVKMEFIYWSK